MCMRKINFNYFFTVIKLASVIISTFYFPMCHVRMITEYQRRAVFDQGPDYSI